MANLYVFHQGEENDGQLWYSSNDNINWTADAQVQNVGIHPRQYPGPVALLSSIRGPVTDSFGTRIPRVAQTGAEILWFRT
jgi:hypothetical protein